VEGSVGGNKGEELKTINGDTLLLKVEIKTGKKEKQGAVTGDGKTSSQMNHKGRKTRTRDAGLRRGLTKRIKRQWDKKTRIIRGGERRSNAKRGRLQVVSKEKVITQCKTAISCQKREEK